MRTFFDKYFFEIDSFLRKVLRRKHETSDKSSKKVATQRPNACFSRSLRNDRTRVSLGRYVATERPFRYVATERNISPCILVYHSMLSPEDRSEPISCFPPF
ncbi:hypothetical protein DY000_02052772 [Brassica cretica]|uniref:Uncharacterized protein n=1 Tax=Brassica cretica TaxID=69181 RepID=A0ABQ7A8I7_BRACR|nr:hypothetical protein DY000_02052772 [Brassica cretica]